MISQILPNFKSQTKVGSYDNTTLNQRYYQDSESANKCF